MPPETLSFGSQEYWNKRFTSNSDPFEWLEAPPALDPFLSASLKEMNDLDLQVLHIGCGTSLLSYHLRAHVTDPKRIHNVDYSEVAVEVGKKREVDLFKPDLDLLAKSEIGESTDEREAPESIQTQRGNEARTEVSLTAPSGSPKPSYMRWSAANILDHSSLLEACQPNTYSMIVDKSTSDSIACSDDVYVPLPYHITTLGNPAYGARLNKSPEPIHPLHIMAVHLALLTKPKARWISLSYSIDRYPFLRLPPPDPSPNRTDSAEAQPSASGQATTSTPMTTSASSAPFPTSAANIATGEDNSEEDMSLDDDLDDIPQKVIDSGFPDPGCLWRLVGKYDIEPPPPPSDSSDGSALVHRPRVMHWVYVLERTDVEVFIKS